MVTEQDSTYMNNTESSHFSQSNCLVPRGPHLSTLQESKEVSQRWGDSPKYCVLGRGVERTKRIFSTPFQ